METEKKEATPANNTQLATQSKTITDKVLKKVTELQDAEQLTLPKNYSVGNALKGAWLVLSGSTDQKGKNLLAECDEKSIANALLDMVVQGLSVTKKQCYFIPYGNKLVCQRSYFGTVAMAKRVGAITEDPVANIVYEGDEFIYKIDPKTGYTHLVKHEQTLDSIDKGTIKAAYCICQTPGGDRVTIMTLGEIKKAWNQSATKGNSPAHNNFAQEMCKKTVIGRACKLAINSSDDAWILRGKDEYDDDDIHSQKRNAETINAGTSEFEENADYEDITNAPSHAPESTNQQAHSEATTGENNEDMPY